MMWDAALAGLSALAILVGCGGGGGGGEDAAEQSAPTISAQPANASVVIGQTATFSVTAIGNPAPTYQWQASANGATYADIPGATAPSYTTPSTQQGDNGKRLRVVVANAIGRVTSNPALLTVGSPSPPFVTLHPSNQTAFVGNNDFANTTATFSAALVGTPTPAYQWQVSADGGRTFQNIEGATSDVYSTPTVTGSDAMKQFRLVGTNASGSVATNPATLFAPIAGIGGEAWGIALRPNGDIVTVVNPFSEDPLRGGFSGLRVIAPSGRVTTLAGSSARTITDGFASGASFRLPWGLALDGSGNAYVIDGASIRKVSPTGQVTTFAGSGAQGGFIDGQGTLARFGGSVVTLQPEGLTIDPDGNLYVSDRGNAAIRKISPSGAVSTLAGGSAGTADGQGAAAKFEMLRGIAISAGGDLYVADNCRIRKVTLSGLVTTISGGEFCQHVDGPLASARFNPPYGMTSDASGNVYVSTLTGVRKISPAGEVSTVNGTVAGLTYSASRGITADTAGNLYVANGLQGAHPALSNGPGIQTQVRKVSPAGVVTLVP
jgi:sugar lactone lactonase YvrE